MKKSLAAILAIAAFATAPANATLVFVDAFGQVESNGIVGSPLGDVTAGEIVVMSFTVDSNNFVDGNVLNTRGYEIGSFSLAFSGGVTVGRLMGSDTAYFTLADGIPASDRFWVSLSPDSPGGVPLTQEPYNANLDLGYDGDTLSSLNILDAQGTYDFDGLTSFGFTVWTGSPDGVAMGIDFTAMQIKSIGDVPIPAALWLLGSSLFGLIGFRRR